MKFEYNSFFIDSFESWEPEPENRKKRFFWFAQHPDRTLMKGLFVVFAALVVNSVRVQAVTTHNTPGVSGNFYVMELDTVPWLLPQGLCIPKGFSSALISESIKFVCTSNTTANLEVCACPSIHTHTRPVMPHVTRAPLYKENKLLFVYWNCFFFPLILIQFWLG